MLHITNGDIVATKLREARLPGDVSVSADVLHEGPCPTTGDVTDFREARARYLTDAGYAVYQEALETLVRQDAALHASRGEDEVVLWFEHDLFDQLQLLRVLAWFTRIGVGRASLTHICIGAFPGVSRFTGLGQLTIGQLASLFPSRQPVTAIQLHRATDAWERFGADTPAPFAALLDEDTSALP